MHGYHNYTIQTLKNSQNQRKNVLSVKLVVCMRVIYNEQLGFFKVHRKSQQALQNLQNNN